MHWQGVTERLFLYLLIEFQSRVDPTMPLRLVQADPNKARLDRLITRWLKRHLRRLGADIDLKQINSLVEDKAMLAENLESWAQRERVEALRADN
ncbi:hypothetical protein [Lamprobacter modestohalophilus]|uniref:hypothetical protein n=1 Tax=Lamprobacter modestohalophilus TaxID=1064514 RepID=UPI001906C810|nr:hypothetical protein [Lamprobacter modestohalophilus]